MANYAKYIVALDAVAAKQVVVAPYKAMSSVTVVRCPIGADVALRLGQANDDFPIAEGDSINDLCGDTDGLYIDVNTASVGDTVTLVVFFDSGNLERGT